MNSSKSSPKQGDKVSFKQVAPFDLFYQLTYMSAMASAGLSRAKTFQAAARSTSSAAPYFVAINTLVDEFRYDYPEACRRVGTKAKSDNIRSFLLRLSDALRSGEPLADFLAREAEVQGEDYRNRYERDLEGLKQWSNAFSSIVISVALIVIIQIITSMIYSLNEVQIGGLVLSGVMMAGFGAYIIYRSAPREVITLGISRGAEDQLRAYRLFRVLVPIAAGLSVLLLVLGVQLGVILLLIAALVGPVGFLSMRSDGKLTKRDIEFSTFLRSSGGMATSSGTTLKQALTRIDLTSFPTLEPDIKRLSNRLQALVEPETCWMHFGQESGSRLISSVVDIFFGAIRMGGDPERVGYLCSLFTAKTTQLRAKRRLTAATFSALTLVMQAIIAVLMVFVLSVVTNFAIMVADLMPTQEMDSLEQQASMSLGMAQFTPGEIQFLQVVTLGMVMLLAVVCALSIIGADGGHRLKVLFFLAIALAISGFSMIGVPPMVAGILQSAIK